MSLLLGTKQAIEGGIQCMEPHSHDIDPWESVALHMINSSHFMGRFHKVGTDLFNCLFVQRHSYVATLYSTSVFIYMLSIILSCKDSVRKCANLLDLTTI